VLSGLAACAALTALVAGVAGAWSPCGFSMVDTIGSALGARGRAASLTSSATFVIGAMLGGLLTFGGLALLGRALGPGAAPVRDSIAAAIAALAAVADWRGARIAPQIRRQVPEHWRWSAPLAVACGLYGILLGLAFTTFVLAFAVWALAGVSFAAGDPALGAAIGLAFGLGRALPVLVMAPRYDSGGAGRLEAMASEPRMWLGLRRLDALGLSVCALLLGTASAGAAVLARATDPSAAGGALAWQQPGGTGELRLRSGQVLALPGSDPALSSSRVAWQSGGAIVVADTATLVPAWRVQVAGVAGWLGVNALALSDGWLVYRAASVGGGEQLVAVALGAGGAVGAPRTIASAPRPGELGRPAISGARVVFTQSTPHSSAIELVDLATGAQARLRLSRRGVALSNPSLLAGRLLYERVTRCAQQLRLAGLRARPRERILLDLPSTAGRDPGYQRGYEHAWNSASLCAGGRAGGGSRRRVGPTALGPRSAFVTVIGGRPGSARVLSLRR
jgi:hypothetical protein